MGVQVLYRFAEADFRWNITEYIPYHAVEAETSSIGEGWNFLKENCLSIWSDDFLRKYMPYRILLASEIYSLRIRISMMMREIKSIKRFLKKRCMVLTI